MARSDEPQINPGWFVRHTEAEKAEAKEQQLAAAKWIEEKWRRGGRPGQPRCPYCGVDDWWIGAPIELPTISGAGVAPPLFPVTCSNCGQTVFVNAVISGIEGADRRKPA